MVDDDCLVIYDHNKPVNVCRSDSKESHIKAKSVNVTVGYLENSSLIYRIKWIMAMAQWIKLEL